MTDKKIGTGSADYEAVFHYVASTEWNWKSSKCHTGNKRLRVEGKKAYCDDRIIAIFDPTRELVVVNHQWDGTNYVNWYVQYGIRRAFEHWKILDVDAVTVKDAEIALKVAIHKYQTRTVRAYMYDCSESLIHYSNLCEFLKITPKESLVKEYQEAKKKWTDKSDKYTEKKRKAQDDARERARHNRAVQLEQFKKAYPVPEGLSYSEKFKWLQDLDIPEGYGTLVERVYWSTHRRVSDDVIKEILGHNCDAVWYEADENRFKTSRGVTVDVTIDLIKLIKIVIQATPEQREKFVGRHVGHFQIRGFVDDTVQVGCHTFLLEDLPSLIKQYENPDPDKISKQIQRLRDRIESCKASIKTFEKDIEEAEKEILTLSSKCDKNK